MIRKLSADWHSSIISQNRIAQLLIRKRQRDRRSAKAGMDASKNLALELDVPSTPTLFVNGRGISLGGAPYETLMTFLPGDSSDQGAVIFTSRTLVTSANTREAEANADAFAATVLHRLGRSSAPLGTFLVRLTGQQNLGALSLLQSHPLSQERLEALKRDDVAETGLPLVDSASWRAIKAMCAGVDGGS